MNIKNIEEAKKYIGKTFYTASDTEKRGKYKVIPLYIGGVFLHYDQVEFIVEGFSVWEDSNYQKYYGKIEKDRISETFDAKERGNRYYFTSQVVAEEYRIWIQKDDIEREKEYDEKAARELLEKHKIKYEIFN